MLIQKLIRDQIQPHSQSQQMNAPKVIAPITELSQSELLAIAGAGAKKTWGWMF